MKGLLRGIIALSVMMAVPAGGGAQEALDMTLICDGYVPDDGKTATPFAYNDGATLSFSPNGKVNADFLFLQETIDYFATPKFILLDTPWPCDSGSIENGGRLPGLPPLPPRPICKYIGYVDRETGEIGLGCKKDCRKNRIYRGKCRIYKRAF